MGAVNERSCHRPIASLQAEFSQLNRLSSNASTIANGLWLVQSLHAV